MLAWEHVVLPRVGLEAQINQKAAPEAKDEKGGQVWHGSFLLLEGEKGRNPRPGQLSCQGGSHPPTLPPREPLDGSLPVGAPQSSCLVPCPP